MMVKSLWPVAVAILVSSAALPVGSLFAADLSKYRDFQFGMDLSAATTRAQIQASEVKVVHERPAVIQEFLWQPRLSSTSLEDKDSVREVLFGFYNGELSRMEISYDPHNVEGLSADDMVQAISATYGHPTKPGTEIMCHLAIEESVKVIARWEDPQYSFNLVRSTYTSSFAMVAYSKRLDVLTRTAALQATRMEAQDAPQKERDRQRKQAADDRAQLDKARLTNQPGFRP